MVKKAIILLVIAVVGFAFGRYSVQSKEITKTVENKVDTKTDIDKNTHKETTITKKPNGEEVTVVVEDTKTDISRTKESSTSSTAQVTVPARKTINISVLAANDYKNPFKPIYGISFQKEFLGPITLGVWGLANSTIGLSIGLNF